MFFSRFVPAARSRVRVAQICGATDGAQWMVDLAGSLRERGYDVVAVIGSADGGTAKALTAVGVPFVAMPQHMMGWRRPPLVVAALHAPRVGPVLLRGLRVAAVLANAVRMAWFLRRRKIDIAHSQVYPSIIVGRIAAWIARVPIRISMVPGPYHLEAPSLRQADLTTQWMDTMLVGGSGRIDELYEEAGIPSARRRVIRYGADPAIFDPALAHPERFREELGLAPDTPLVGQVALFYPPVPAWSAPPLVGDRGTKGHDDFVDAARLVLDERPEVRFVLVGGGWGEHGEIYRQSIMRRCHELGIDHATTFTGQRTDIRDVLAALDVSVQCSLSENYGGTIESLMMRAPTIATRVGGMPEAVRHEETGLLVPPRDPPALAQAILRLLDDPELAARLGEQGRAWMEGFTTQGMCDGVRDLYEELLRQKLPWKVIPAAAS